MEVILLSDVKNVGKKGQIVNVSDGFAKNLLLPRKLAVMATTHSREIKQEQDEKAAELYAANKQKALDLKAKLEAVTVNIVATSGSDGRMFGSISSKEVVEELKKQHNLEVDKKKFIGESIIKCLGVTNLKNELFKGVVATIKVNVKEK